MYCRKITLPDRTISLSILHRLVTCSVFWAGLVVALFGAGLTHAAIPTAPTISADPIVPSGTIVMRFSAGRGGGRAENWRLDRRFNGGEWQLDVHAAFYGTFYGGTAYVRRLEDGDYEHRLSGCNSSGCSEPSAVVATTVAAGTPSLSISTTTVDEGEDIAFRVYRSGRMTESISVSYATSDRSATADDYVGTSGTVTLGADERAKAIIVPTKIDDLYENTEMFTMEIFDPTPGVLLGTESATGVIRDLNDAPQFSVGNASVEEGGVLSFTIRKDGSTQRDHGISYKTYEDLAQSDDFTRIGYTRVTFTPEQTSLIVRVQTTEDTVPEPDETMILELDFPGSGAHIVGAGQGIGTIIDDDSGPTTPEPNRAVTSTFVYDALGRLRNASDTEGRDRDYDFDAAGNRTSVTDN